MSTAVRRLKRILTFRDLSVRNKFLLFSIGALFWLLLTSAIGITAVLVTRAECERLVDLIGPHQQAVSAAIRKLRGASVSAHKVVLYGDTDSVTDNVHRALTRLDDSADILNAMLGGGIIRDNSVSTEHTYDEYVVRQVSDPEERARLKTAAVSIGSLRTIIAAMATVRHPGISASHDLLERLQEYDSLTKDTVSILAQLSVTLARQWDGVLPTLKNTYHNALIFLVIALAVGTLLSILFGVLIARSISSPVKALTARFQAFNTRDTESERRIAIDSKDELGTLGAEYNKFMDTIAIMSSFKSLIEEDETAEDVYRRLGEAMTSALCFTTCTIYEVATDSRTIFPVYPSSAPETALHCQADILHNSDCCRAKRTGHAVSSLEHEHICRCFLSSEASSHICYPILLAGKVGGIAQLVLTPQEAAAPDLKERIERAKQYFKEAQPVLDAKRLTRAFKESSIKDDLTGLYNRRFVDETSAQLIAGVLRRGSSLGLLMCDLDFFKEVNDTYGHDVGDRILKQTAALIKGAVRASDVAVRFGGEEFLVLLIDIDSDASLMVAEKIRRLVEQMRVNVAGAVIQKTISVGVSEVPTDTQNLWEAVKYADVALYKAKESGRNRVARFAPEMWTTTRY